MVVEVVMSEFKQGRVPKFIARVWLRYGHSVAQTCKSPA
jgi:hypothetical protein